MKKYFIYFSFLMQPFCISAQIWQAVGGGLNGIGSSVLTLGTYNNELYASGSFDSIGGIYTGLFARWNGNQWNPASINGGPNGLVKSFEIINNELYTVGDFTHIDNVQSTKYLAKWNGSQWDSVHYFNPSSDRIYAIEYLNQIYIGGQFTTVTNLWMSPTTVNNITTWNNNSWKSVAGGITGGFISEVRCMAVYNGELYIGGDFTMAGNITANYIARWNGIDWDSIGSGTNAMVSSMTVDTINNILYVGGAFNTAGGINSNWIAKWDGNCWSSVGNIITDGIYSGAMCMYRGNLWVGAGSPNGLTTDTVLAYWDGANWHPVLGPNSTIASLYVYNDELYVGGYFDKVDTGGGILTVNYIARLWMPPSGIEDSSVEEKEKVRIYPNPGKEIITIEISDFDSLKKIHELKIEIYNAVGKIMYQSEIHQKRSEIHNSAWTKGTYFINILSDKKIIAAKKFIRN